MDMHKMTPWHWLHQIGCGFVVYLTQIVQSNSTIIFLAPIVPPAADVPV